MSVALTQRPLLNPAEITQLQQQGHHWSGHGAPWRLRETLCGRSGEILSSMQGSGTDFAETRPYQAGDEPRHINWRATARAARPMVRVFHEDLLASSFFLIDRRASMRFGTQTRLKVTQAARLAIFLASWEAGRGAEIGAMLLNEQPQWQAPRSGNIGINHLISATTAPCPPGNKSTLPLSKALQQLDQRLPAGSHIYLLSDFIDLDTRSQSVLFALGQRHHVWALQLFDPAEQRLPVNEHLQLLSPARDATLTLNPLGCEQLAQAFKERKQLIKQYCDDADISLSLISTNDAIPDAL